MTHRAPTCKHRHANFAILAAFALYVALGGQRSADAQSGDFLKTDRTPTSTSKTDTSASNVATVVPSSRDYLFDERYQWETTTVGNLLSLREQRYVDGLLERGLTHLAEFYCRKRLHFDSLDTRQKAGYARALLQSQKQNLLNSSPQNRNAVRLQIEATNREIDSMFADTPWSTEIALQQIRVALADVELELAERQTSRQSLDQPAERLAGILSRIDAEAERVSRRIAIQPASTTVSDEMSTLMSLTRLLQFRKAVALRLLSSCRPEQQTESLAQALVILRPMIIAENSPAISPEQTALSNFAAFEAIACHRDLRQYDEIEALRNALQKSNFLTPRQRAMLSIVDLLSAVDHRDEQGAHRALQTIETALTDAKSLDITQQIKRGVPELTLARLQGYLFFWKRNLETRSSLPHLVGTTTAPDIAVCRTNVIDILRRIENDFAPYWRDKAESIISREAAFFGNDPVFAEHHADTLARQGRLEEAIDGYDSLAASLGVSDPVESFRIARKAVDLSIIKADRQRQRNEETTTLERSLVDRLRKLAKSNAKHPQAAETHLAATYHAARLLQADRMGLDDYLSLLVEHYLTWPQSKQADALRLQAAQLLLHESKFREALDALAPVNNRSPVALAVVETAERTFDRLRLTEQNVNAKVEGEAVSWFYTRLLSADKSVVADWNEADGQCLLATAKFGLLYAGVIERNRAANPNVNLSAAYGSVEKVLRIGLARYQQAPSQWRSTVDSMLLYLLTVQGKNDEATQLMQTMRQWDVAALMTLLDRLQRQADLSPSGNTSSDDTPSNNRRTLGQMRLDIVRLIEQRSDTSPQNASDMQRLNVIRADALADTGNVQTAVDQLSAMLRQTPGDVELLVALARVLGRQSDVKSRELALRTWQSVEQRSPSRSESWWDAKEAILRLLVTSGNAQKRQQAESSFEMLQILNPDLGSPDRRLRFNAIFQRD